MTERRIYEAKVQLHDARERERHWRGVLDGVTSKTPKGGIGTARYCLRKAVAAAERLEAELTELEGKDMARRQQIVNEPVGTTDSGEGRILVCRKSGGVRCDGKHYAIGQKVPRSILSTLNGEFLVQRGFLVWQDESAWKAQRAKVVAKPEPKLDAKSQPATEQLPDNEPLTALLDAMAAIDAERRCGGQVAYELAHTRGSVIERYVKWLGEMPRTINTGGWGGDGGHPTAVGAGQSYRRVVDDAPTYALMAYAARKKKEAA
jgi:hypothetical protein